MSKELKRLLLKGNSEVNADLAIRIQLFKKDDKFHLIFVASDNKRDFRCGESRVDEEIIISCLCDKIEKIWARYKDQNSYKYDD